VKYSVLESALLVHLAAARRCKHSWRDDMVTLAHVMAVMTSARKPRRGKAAAARKAARHLAPARAAVIPDHTVLGASAKAHTAKYGWPATFLGAYQAVNCIVNESGVRRDRSPNAQALRSRISRHPKKCTASFRSHPGWVQIIHAGRNEPAGSSFTSWKLGDDESPVRKIDPDRYAPKTLAVNAPRRQLPPGRMSKVKPVAVAEAPTLETDPAHSQRHQAGKRHLRERARRSLPKSDWLRR